MSTTTTTRHPSRTYDTQIESTAIKSVQQPQSDTGHDRTPHLNRLACSRLLGAREVKPDMAEGMLPPWLRAVALVTEPDVLTHLLSLLQDWADSHRGRPRVVVDMWTDREHGPLHAVVLMGCVIFSYFGSLACIFPGTKLPLDHRPKTATWPSSSP